MTGWAIALGVASFAHGLRMERQGKKENKKAQKKEDALMQEQLERQKQLDAFGRPLLEQGRQNMETVQQYLQRLASGDRSLTMQTLAPEINAMTDQARGGMAAARQAYPRSGQTAAQASQFPQQLQGGINNMIFGARPQAMQQLSQLGGNQASLGLGAMGQGAGLTNNMLDYGLRARELMFNQGMMAGQGFAGNMGMLQYGLNSWMANRQQNQALSPYTAQQQPGLNPAPGQNWGKSSLGFNQQNPPGSTYTPNNNPYGWGSKP